MEKKETGSSTDKVEYENLRQKLKDREEMKKYVNLLRVNKIMNEHFELKDFLDCGGSSNVYLINVNQKKDGKNLKKNVIMKAVISKRNQREVQKESMILSKLKNKYIIDFYVATNMDQYDLTITVPTLPGNKKWYRVADTAFESPEELHYFFVNLFQ